MIKVLAKADKTAEVLIHEPIGADWMGDGLTSKRFAQDLKALGDVNAIKVRMNSPGGSVSDGIGIYNILRSHGARIEVSIEGMAASIASVIAMAGDTISMGEGALMMIHNPWTLAIGDAEAMRKTADVLDKHTEALADIYVKRTGMDRAELRGLLNAETWLNGQEAVTLGFADTAATGEAKNELREAFTAFASTFRKPADITPLRIAAILKSATAADLAPKESVMEKDTTAATPAEIAAAQSAAVAAALAVEQSRTDTIRARFQPFVADHRELMDACLADQKITAEVAGEKLLTAVAAKQAGPLGNGGANVTAGQDAVDKFRAGAEQSMLARIGRAKREDGNEYNGLSLVDLAARALALRNISVRGLTKDGIARKVLAAHTSSDFPALLSSTAGKVLRQAYEIFPATWRAWAAAGQVSDFKIHPRIQLGSFSGLATIPEGGEYTYGTLTEAYENAQAATKGKAISFTRQMLVNDDLSGFNRRAQLMGDAAARTVNTDAYTSLTSASGLGPTSVDTGTFFNATAVTTAGGHANYTSSGTAMSVASLGVGRVAMQKQKDAGLVQTLNIVPKVLLTSVGKEDVARTLIASETDPASSNSRVPNIYRNQFTVVADPFIDSVYANSWYLFADPAGPAAAFEIVFLDGNEVPFIDDEVDFDTDALKFKVRLDYGIAIGDWRGAYRNVGA